MIFVKRLIRAIILAIFINCVYIIYATHVNTFIKITAAAVLFAAYVHINMRPRKSEIDARKLKALIGGYELTLLASFCLIFECLLYVAYIVLYGLYPNVFILVINGVVCLLLVAITLIGGLARIFIGSGQLGAKNRLLIIFLWWAPVVNIVLFYQCCRCARLEYEFELAKLKRNRLRKDQMVCKTKYPILMVHGIFFRDWKLFDYWGRIPDELRENGADIYYGNQQSSTSVELSAIEIEKRIKEVVNETGCDKVNIIAHSKGGLDARYAISALGAGRRVASLTTINTPHMGCAFAGKLIDMTPAKLVATLGKKYESLFAKLGDSAPDFFGGVSELTLEKCAELNEKVIDDDSVVYQSAGSKMASASASPFPLSVGYRMIEPLEGENDGLVATKSMAWGKFLGIVDPPGKTGISHGDMIDLTRKNIYGFDVTEFYVDLARGLKERGL